MKQICESCGKIIEEKETAYRMKIELFADPQPPEFSEEDLEEDLEGQLRALIEEMETFDPHDVREAEEQVHEAYLFTLCARCRHAMHHELRLRHLPFEN
jgi:FPC/CPF motif-containing protein YcgG